MDILSIRKDHVLKDPDKFNVKMSAAIVLQNTSVTFVILDIMPKMDTVCPMSQES